MIFLITYIYINHYFLYITKYSPKLLPKTNSQSYVIEAYFAYSRVHNYSRKLFTKLLPKILPKICSSKLVPEAAPEQLSTTPKLVPNIIPKNVPEINSPKLTKIAIKNLSRDNTKGTCLTGDAGQCESRHATGPFSANTKP